MKKGILLLLVLAGAVAAGARADGGGPASILFGGKGVLAPDGKVRYVALTTGRQTMLSAIRVRGGQVIRSRLVHGYLGVPVVGLDGTTGGVSRDGRTVVLAATPTASRSGVTSTRFAVVETRRFRLREVELMGSWSYDAISPDSKTLFLVEYLSTGPTPPYRVRAYNLTARRLFAKVVVDRQEKEAVMFGQPVTRATSADGRWAYTLYARARQQPFVHALDTVRRQARCVDLPLRLGKEEQMGLRLRIGAGGELEVRSGRTTAAVVDTTTFGVRRS